VRQAVERKLFAKVLQSRVSVGPDLETETAQLLRKSALGSLGMANKAGLVVTGLAKATDLVRSGKARLVLSASDAAEDGLNKVSSAIRATGKTGSDSLTVMRCFASIELDHALGGGNIMHVAAQFGGATGSLAEKVERLEQYIRQ